LKIASKLNGTNFDNSKLRNYNIEKVQYEIARASKSMWKRTSRKKKTNMGGGTKIQFYRVLPKEGTKLEWKKF
jgi:hypothetical protein